MNHLPKPLFPLVFLPSTLVVSCFLPSGHAGGDASGKRVNVVLVHGIKDTGRKFDAMRKALKSAGCRCFAPSLTPNDGSSGVRDLAVKLSARIDAEFGRSAPFFIVGFSLGGLVARDYVQNLARRRRVLGVCLIATPNHGTLWALLAANPQLRQLATGSPFTTALNANLSVWRGIPVSSYWTPLDLMIVPPVSSILPVGSTKMVLCPVHPMMVDDRVVIEDIREKIQAWSGRSHGGLPADSGTW